jgi:hypothetical protein
MLDDELNVEEQISYVYIEKEHCKVTLYCMDRVM